MDAKHLKAWRKSLELSQKEAAEALGLKRRIFQYYEKGERDGEAVKVPKTVRLACWALTQGVIDYEGPEILDDKKKPEKPKKAAKKPAKPEKKAETVVVIPPVVAPVPAKAAPAVPAAEPLKPAAKPLAVKPAAKAVAKPAAKPAVTKAPAKLPAKPAAK